MAIIDKRFLDELFCLGMGLGFISSLFVNGGLDDIFACGKGFNRSIVQPKGHLKIKWMDGYLLGWNWDRFCMVFWEYFWGLFNLLANFDWEINKEGFCSNDLLEMQPSTSISRDSVKNLSKKTRNIGFKIYIEFFLRFLKRLYKFVIKRTFWNSLIELFYDKDEQHY